MPGILDFASSFVGSLLAEGRGVMAIKNPNRPELPLELYDMEGSPFCRVVREVMTQLDLNVIIYPCPKNGTRFRPMVEELGGKQQFPFLVDPNTNQQMYESHDIIAYLYDHYGDGKSVSKLATKAIRTPASIAISIVRLFKGIKVRESKQPEKPLILYSFESSPFARFVRESLCEHELPYLLLNVGRTEWQDYVPPPVRERLLSNFRPNHKNRLELTERSGNVTVPYLIDPNTDVEMGESADILEYLDHNYAI
ncbi:MAG: glutathione S-transferase N-terminal domain-containing protein [Pseudomonadales bacterium]|nr:glutathione S-transferase N-terminal domain-containing protein [Pseudomonadales bacterium]